MSSSDPPKPSRIIKLRVRKPDRDAIPGQGTLAPPSAAPASSAAAPAPSAAAPAPSVAAPVPSSGETPRSPAPTTRRSTRTTAGKGNDVAPGPSLPVPTTRRLTRASASTEGALAQGRDSAVHLPQRAIDLGKASSEQTDGKGKALVEPSNDKIEVRHLMEDSIKASVVQYHEDTGERHKLPPKLQKVLAKCNKERALKVEIARAEFDRALEKINADHSLSVMAALSEALQSPDVALVYHEDMMDHSPPEGFEASEKPERVSAILKKLGVERITDRCQLVKAVPTTYDVLCRVHNPDHVKNVIDLSLNMPRDAKPKLLDGYEDMYCSIGTSDAALLAAGAAIQAAELVVSGPFMSSFAIVRPPGHHVVKKGRPYGFCFLNNIAVAADHLLHNHNMKKILIVDIDIHHGNGTQDIFYDDKRVLFFSVHRYDKGFFPVGSGELDCIGSGDAVGYNINVCWGHRRIGDVDYVAVWKFLLLPLIEEFGPEIILISAGFDAGADDPLGKCNVTVNGFACLLQLITSYAIPIAMILEGGYNLTTLSNSVAACVSVLLGDKTNGVDLKSKPYDSTWKVISETRNKFKQFWKCFEDEVPKKGYLQEI